MKKEHVEYLKRKTNGCWKELVEREGAENERAPRSAIIYELSHIIQLLLGMRNLAAMKLNLITDSDISALGLYYRKIEVMEPEEDEDHIIYTNTLSPRRLNTFITVWDKKMKTKDVDDDERIGELLGYPQCCVKRFVSPEGILASLFQRTQGIPSFFDTFPFITHRPCSFNCQETMKINSEVENALLKICPEVVQRAKLEVVGE